VLESTRRWRKAKGKSKKAKVYASELFPFTFLFFTWHRRMRVVAGSHKGRRLLQPKGRTVRPTSERVKEALFSILGDRIQGVRFVDLCAGTGAIGIEALSRGASRVSFVESNPASLRLLRANLKRTGLAESADVYTCTAETFLKRLETRREPVQILFADPPYTSASLTTLLRSLGHGAIMTSETVVILEHATKTAIPPSVGQLILRRQYHYGDTTLSLFVLGAEGTPAE
jgi:16S rRNA (guanine(966)-N(2))-methyltransferase RsmD